MLYDPKWEVQVETKIEPWRRLLLDAANVIEQRGHCKGAIEDGQGRVCALGALLVAEHGATNRCIAINIDAFVRLTKRVAPDNISQWNNARERTAAEVVATMRDVARGGI